VLVIRVALTFNVGVAYLNLILTDTLFEFHSLSDNSNWHRYCC